MLKSGEKIFIAIPSYRDDELLPTLMSLISMAKKPECLHISVCWQSNGDLSVFRQAGLSLNRISTRGRFPHWQGEFAGALIDILNVEFTHSRGVCWARNLCESFFQNEDYFLQLDSHARFQADWDAALITMLESLRSVSAKPVLSTYLPNYQPGSQEKRDPHTYRLVFEKFSPEGIPLLIAHAFSASEPVRSCFMSGHFIFADSHFVRDVPNDPDIYFTGEETAMALRAFSYGYDVYAPHRTLIWHQYGRDGSSRHWDDNAQHTGGKKWWELDLHSKNRVRALLLTDGMDNESSDVYGLGTVRNVHDFERASGLCFATRQVDPRIHSPERCGYFGTIAKI